MTATEDRTTESAPYGDKRYVAVEHTMERFDYQEHGLIEVLITAQEEFGCLSKEMLTYVSDKLNLPLSQVYGVATFYDMFTLETVGTTHAMVCTGPTCLIAGAKDVLAEACELTGVSEPGQTSPDGKHSVKEATCLGLCDQAPAALINKQAQVNLSIDDVPAMLQGRASSPCIQVCGEPRILTAPIGRLSPTDLDAHRLEGAFTALEKALCTMTPEDVIEEVKDSRLSGRGGAGFQTGLKWQMAREVPGKPKYIVCNFDESEPGTFKDRVLMEGNPFRVIEGMTIGAYATDAHKGYIYIRGEYPTATEIVEEAVDKLYAENLLGDNILGSSFTVDIEVRHNAGAYICGEETALFESIEGKRGHPRTKPPYPTQAGLFGKPTVINNVETMAVVPSLILNGGEWFCQWGSGNSVGLKLFCLSGHVMQPGVVEAPLGTTIRELIEDYGGGFIGEPQAILVGGAAGGFLHPDNLDTPLTHEDLSELDVPIGSGAITVFNQSVNLWQVLQGLAHFFVHETCGRCAPCRLGTMQIYNLLNKINLGMAASSDLRKVEKLGGMIKKTCMCGLGMTAANPVLTVLHHFKTAPIV
ncbi:MAG: NADH-quinone oxidoreductase subunit NuoF [Anaerolineales bacterium]|nr:NADH-quinone oxidoreductase subunit NuoF [Anaerolineales bacterium]